MDIINPLCVDKYDKMTTYVFTFKDKNITITKKKNI